MPERIIWSHERNWYIRPSAHTSSRAIACLKTRIAVFTVTKGKGLCMISPTLATVSLLNVNHLNQIGRSSRNFADSLVKKGNFQDTHQTPRKSIVTARQKVALNPSASFSLSKVLKRLYAKGTCSMLSFGSRPIWDDGTVNPMRVVRGKIGHTLNNIPARARAVYAPREKPKIPQQIRSPSSGNVPNAPIRWILSPTL